MSKVINIIIRQTGEKTVLKGEGNLSISVSAPSVIEIQASPKAATKYIRQGNDLFIYMEDGSVIRCTGYFVEDPDSGKHSELVFKDEHGLTHIAFAETEAAPGLAATELTAQATPVHSIEPFIESASDNSLWGWVAGAAVGGGVIGALLGKNGHHTKTKEKTVDNTRETDPARPTFMVADDQGDRQGMLTSKAVTDDNTPVFSGTGHPGATIQIKDSRGNTIASTMVGKEGTWSVKLAAQPDGTHQWSVVQIHGDKTASAGDIKLTISTQQAELAFATIAEDNQINAAEQSAGFTLSGTSAQLVQGTALSVTLNGKTYLTTVGTDGRWQVAIPAEDAKALSDGSWTVSVTGQDLTGNVISASQTLNVDTQPPVIIVDTVAQDDIINAVEHNQPLMVSGKTNADAGQVVSVRVGDKSYSTTVSGDGRWALEIPAGDLAELRQGTSIVTAAVSDGAGNRDEATHELLVDTLAPTITINTVANDDIVNVAEQQVTQTISGTTTAEAGQIITVTFNDQHYTATVDGNGNWSVNVPASTFLGLSDGVHSVNVTVSDRAGNSGSASHNVTLSGEVPTIAIDTFAQDDIINAAEHGTPLVINGTTSAQAGQTVTLTLNGRHYTTTVTEGGKWSYTVGSADIADLADGGAYVINAQVNNAIGNSASADHTVTVDLTAPSMGITIDSLQNDTGLSSSDFITRDGAINVQGTLTAALGNNEKAQISLDGGVSWIDLVVSGKQWSYSDSRTLTDGTYACQVRVIDSAGNVGATHSQEIVVDLTAPAATTLTIDSVSQDYGLSGSDFITSDNQISLQGTLGAALGSGEHLQLSIDGGASWIDIAASGTRWTWVDERTLADGDYNYMLRVIDDAGNISATASQLVKVDTVAPDVSKTITIDSITDDTGLVLSDFITQDSSLTLQGTLGARLMEGEFAQISLDGGNTWQNVTVIGTTWHFTDERSLENGTYDYWVRVVDVAGNLGDVAKQQVIVDSVAPDAAITIDRITTDTGFDDNDFLTSEASYTLHGTLSAELAKGELVQISLDNGNSWMAAEVNGTRWRYVDARELTDGEHTYKVRVTDQAGNIGATTSQVVTIDTSAPEYGITIDAITNDTGLSGTDFITADATLTLNGSLGSPLASGERVQISFDDGDSWIDVNVDGRKWSYTDSRELPEGDCNYQVRIIDKAGNLGSTAQQKVTVDTTAPEIDVDIASYTDEDGERQGQFGASVVTDDTTPIINGTLSRSLEEGEIAELYRDGVLLGQVIMNSVTSWYFQDNGLTDGKYAYVIRITDAAGNITESDEFVLTVDTTIPTTKATIQSLTTADNTPILSGSLSAALINGEYVEVRVNGKTYTSETGGAVVIDPANNTWYLQIPQSEALEDSTYSVTAQIKSSAGNGNTTGIAAGSLVINTETFGTEWASIAGNAENSSITYGINDNGLWGVIGNGQSFSSNDMTDYSAVTLTNTRNNFLVSQTVADFDRNGTTDIFGTENTYADSTQIMWTYNGHTYEASQLAMGTTIWYGGVIAYDKTGDGYLDLAYGDAGMDSRTYLVNNNGVISLDGEGGRGGFTDSFISGREISGVDLNNDGAVDIVQHTNKDEANALTAILNNGNGTLAPGQTIKGVFVDNAANSTTAASMTWADFDGDGYMDLYLSSSYGNNGGVIYYNMGNGQLSTSKSAVEASNAAQGFLSVATDWNHDGQMDVIKFSTYGGSQTVTLFSNRGNGSSWSATQLASNLVDVTGIAAMDYNWDGAKDLLVSQANGKIIYVKNEEAIADGTAMHLRILDSEGINVYYGNTINLYDSNGVRVASQIINAQSGIGVNDTSALVSFYGLDPEGIYRAEIVKFTNGTQDNVIWNGLKAGNGKEGYVLTADAATGGHEGTLTGTGYNDIFIAEAGSYTYVGSGGWSTTSDHNDWSNNGGMDIVDYRNSTVGVTVDLRGSSVQDTGFNSSRLINIEGVAGSDANDVFTGNSLDNLFEGRGGNDIHHIGSGGHDTLLYTLLKANDATGGNGSDQVNGFTVGTWEGTADTDRIDLRELLSGSGYSGSGSATYVNGVATLAGDIGNLSDFIKVVQNGSNTEIQIDRDGAGSEFSAATVLTLNGVQTDLATLLANHQLLVV